MTAAPKDFIRARVDEDLRSGRHRQVVTRFPPEPNGYLHLGHAKSICLNFGIASEHGGRCNLRFDDTNPLKESEEFVEAIKRDIRWLGFEWSELHFASDYFETLYDYALQLIRDGLAYVDSQTDAEIRAGRGSLTEPGRDSPWRQRSAVENEDLFRRMRAGEFPDGAHVLRARIDMTAGNINLRDPVLYRIRHARHHNTGDAWCIYPLYDFTHGFSDAIEGVTHSLCSLEFEDHRPLYDWFLDKVGTNARPQQIEFSKLQVEHMVMSKRFYSALIAEGALDGWSDPRLPTLAGLRRRGYSPASIRDFCGRVGITKAEGLVELKLLEYCVRRDLEAHAPRAMAVLDPIRVVVDNHPGDDIELMAPWHPKDESQGGRQLVFGRELWIEREDWSDAPPKGWKRLAPGVDVRLRYAFIVRAERVERDASGRVTTVHVSYYPDTRSGDDHSGRKAAGVIHWLPRTAVPVKVRLYEPLFHARVPDREDLAAAINPKSRQVLAGALVEPALAASEPGQRYQFERQGYFIADERDSRPGHLVFNRIVELRDTYKPA